MRLCETERDEGKIQIRTICLVVHKRCVYELSYHDTYHEISPTLMQTCCYGQQQADASTLCIVTWHEKAVVSWEHLGDLEVDNKVGYFNLQI